MINADRLTVKAAEALNESISLARENGNPLVYDLHLLLALLEQDESIVVPILQKLGVERRRAARAGRSARSRATRSRRDAQPTHVARAQPGLRPGRGRSARSSATSTSRPSTCCSRSPTRRAPRRATLLDGVGRHARGAARGARGGARHRTASPTRSPENQYQALAALHARPHRGRAQGQARSRHRPRRGDPPRHPGALAPHEEQSGAHRRARRRQDGHRRRARAAHRQRRRAREPARTSGSSRSTSAR